MKNFITSAIIMLLLPFLAVTFVQGDNGMAVCFILFYAINPMYALLVGISAGKNIKVNWQQPIICALLFLLGTWLFFTINEVAFLIYAGIYLLIGLVTMFISHKLFSKI